MVVDKLHILTTADGTKYLVRAEDSFKFDAEDTKAIITVEEVTTHRRSSVSPSQLSQIKEKFSPQLGR